MMEKRGAYYMESDAKQEYIEKSTRFLNNCLNELENVIHMIQKIEDPNLEDANETIIAMLYDFYVILDGVRTLAQSGRFRATSILVRSLIELTAQILYLCDDIKTVNEKALCYKLYTTHKRREALEYNKNIQDLQKDELYQKYRDMETNSDDEYVIQKQNELKTILNDTGYLNYWYTLYDKNLKSIRFLIKRIKKSIPIERLYGKFSQITHGGDAISNIKVNGNQLSLKKVDSVKNGFLLLNVLANLIDLLIEKLDNLYSNNGEHKVYAVISENYCNNQKALYKEIKELDKNIDD